MVDSDFSKIEAERIKLEKSLTNLILKIGKIPIANKEIMPYGWRKAAKGRTVWRILEEIISQNIEKHHIELGFEEALPAESEVGVYDFEFKLPNSGKAYVNIKSAVKNTKISKDDISKADKLYSFLKDHPQANLYIATFELSFNEDMTISIEKCTVFPVAWIPDVYVNPSNNGNLQSAHYKDLNEAVKRTNEFFRAELYDAIAEATNKKKKKFETANLDIKD